MRAATHWKIRWGSRQTGSRLVGRGGCFLLLVELAVGAVMAQSVADVAKKSKEQSKDKQARIVITDQQLKPSRTAATGSQTNPEKPPTVETGGSTTGNRMKSTEEETNAKFQKMFDANIELLRQYLDIFNRLYYQGSQVAQAPSREELHSSYLKRKAIVGSVNEQLSKVAAQILKIEQSFQGVLKRARQAGVSRKMMRKAEETFKSYIDPWKKAHLTRT